MELPKHTAEHHNRNEVILKKRKKKKKPTLVLCSMKPCSIKFLIGKKVQKKDLNTGEDLLLVSPSGWLLTSGPG